MLSVPRDPLVFAPCFVGLQSGEARLQVALFALLCVSVCSPRELPAWPLVRHWRFVVVLKLVYLVRSLLSRCLFGLFCAVLWRSPFSHVGSHECAICEYVEVTVCCFSRTTEWRKVDAWLRAVSHRGRCSSCNIFVVQSFLQTASSGSVVCTSSSITVIIFWLFPEVWKIKHRFLVVNPGTRVSSLRASRW